ncbi:uncharacterized protein LOC142169580 [Nicotiana tabacum]|uniref:Uncharacterized protein LOC142169580 n=1 Tax=Nicotiana tabacum TaxID=4097 RepID=A0AC58SRG3_TOBAC
MFTWLYDDMPRLSTNIVSNRLPTDPVKPPVKQEPRKFKPDLSLRIKQEVTKQIEANVVRVTNYPTWLANIIPVPKKDGKIRICVNYRDHNKARPKYYFPLPNIHILIDNCAKNELQSFMDCFAGFHQILMHEEDAEKIAFTTPWGVYWVEMFFDGAANFKGVGIGAVLIIELGQHYPTSAKIRFPYTNNMAEYEACILMIRMEVDINIKELLVVGDTDMLIHQVQGEWTTKNVKILLYLHCHPDKYYIGPIEIEIRDQHAYYFHVNEEPNGKPRYYDIKRLLETREYPKNAANSQKRALRRLVNHFFLNGEFLYRRTPNLGLLRCVDVAEATRLLEEIHVGMCGPHINGFTLAKKILRAGYFWMTMESDSVLYVQKCHQSQIHGDFIQVPLNELNVMGSPCPFAAWCMDVIKPIRPVASNGHCVILVEIDYITKWVEVST